MFSNTEIIPGSNRRHLYLRLTHLFYSILILFLACVSFKKTTLTLNSTYLLSLRLDYLVHFAVFIPWMGMVWIAYRINFRENFARAAAWICIGLLFCWITEGIQYYIPYRAFNLNDLAANTIGIFLGSLFFLFRVPSLRFLESN